MKVLSLALPVMACAIAFVVSITPSHAQSWYEEYVTYDSTDSGGAVFQDGATATYDITSPNMSVTTTASGDGTSPPGYMAETLPLANGVYYITVAWGGYDPPTYPPPTYFIIGLSGSVQAVTEIDTPLTARAAASAEIYDASHTYAYVNTLTEGPPTENFDLTADVPSGTEILIPSSGAASGTAYDKVTLSCRSFVSAGDGPPDGSAISYANSAAGLVATLVGTE